MPINPSFAIAGIVAAAFALTGCRQDMHDQPRYKPLGYSHFFEDGRQSRPILANTIARGQLHEDSAYYSGKDANGRDIAKFPLAVDRALLERGQNRFDIYCSPCHGRVGNGLGMIVRRGFKQPPSYHTDRLRNIGVGHFYDVITNGYGSMLSYSQQIQPRDRWAISAYIRALQYSQNADLAGLPPDQRAKMPAPGSPGATVPAGELAPSVPGLQSTEQQNVPKEATTPNKAAER